MTSFERYVEDVSGEIETLFQKYERMLKAKRNLCETDSQSLEYAVMERRYKNARDNFTAAKYILAERIAQGAK